LSSTKSESHFYTTALLTREAVEGIQELQRMFQKKSYEVFLLLYSLSDSVDNSEYMRNGDFLPTRLQAQQDAVNIVCHSKTRSNPENNVGLITLAKYVGQS
jgi:chlorite dismutase